MTPLEVTDFSDSLSLQVHPSTYGYVTAHLRAVCRKAGEDDRTMFVEQQVPSDMWQFIRDDVVRLMIDEARFRAAVDGYSLVGGAA